MHSIFHCSGGTHIFIMNSEKNDKTRMKKIDDMLRECTSMMFHIETPSNLNTDFE